jgi:endonuclease/exonuclease/phosphatase (EEP) superfamily protein YafD
MIYLHLGDYMTRYFLLLALTLSAQFNAQASGWMDRYIKVVPEAEAHTFSGVAREFALSDTSIKVLVWNVKKAEMKPWQEEFNRFGKDRDLYLIQEAYQDDLFNTTLAMFSEVRWDMGISFLYRLYNDTATGNMIGSVAEPSFVKVMHTIDLEPGVSTPKATTYAKYPIENSEQELLVISVHGINLTSYGSFERHILQARAEIEKHTGPVLFAGDFNTRTAARTKYLMKVVKELKLTPVEFKNPECRMRFKLTPYYLDHSFVRDLKVKNAQVECDSHGSDHHPMMLEVGLNL